MKPLTRFCETLFANTVGLGRELVLLYQHGRHKRSVWCATIEQAVERAVEFDKVTDVYFGVSLQHRDLALEEARRREAKSAAKEQRAPRETKLEYVRGYESTAQVLGGLWADFDIKNEHHDKKGLPESLDDVKRAIAKLPHRPGAVLLTGGGVHAWWPFQVPVELSSEADRAAAKALSRGWQGEIRRVCKFTLDATHDLTRMMRLPGLHNHKYGAIIELQEDSGARYMPADFKKWALGADLAMPPPAADPGWISQHRGEAPTARIQVMIDCDPKFAASWRRQRPDFPSQSEYDLSLASLAARAGWSDQEIVSTVLEHRRLGGPSLVADVFGREDYFTRLLAKARAHDAGAGNQPGGVARPRIIVRPGQQHVAVVAAEDVLLGQPRPPIFQRDRLLVRLLTLPDATEQNGVRRPPGATVVEPVDYSYLVNLLTRLIDWRKETNSGLRPVDAPGHVVEALLASSGEWRLPPLRGLIEAPTIRRDGTLLLANGYDAQTGLLLDYVGPDLPPIADAPSREDALRALQSIEKHFEHFPFVQECDRSVLVAAILTSLVRRTLRTAPMFLFRAPARGSGKSLLADCVALIATGRPCAALTAGQDSSEERKQLFSILLEGDLIVCIDNVERPLSSSDLCVALTQKDYKGRLLGHSKTVKVPTNVLWMATGNNLLVEGDLVSRVLTCDLDPNCEAPESREFDGDLREQMLEQRGEIIHAALTILRAYHAAGRPPVRLPAYGRFEEWSRTVRAPLVWLGRSDSLETAARLRGQDPATNRLQALLHAWYHRFAQPTTISALVRAASEHRAGDLFEALSEIGGSPSGGLDPKAIGTFVRMNAGRIIDRMCIQRVGVTHGSARWQVRLPGGDGGDGGDRSNPQSGITSDGEVPARAHAHAWKGEGGVPPVPPGDSDGSVAEEGARRA